ncbi:hypothetical protein JMJ35_003575 [Cladonia borealis]|uniref:Uncharacterized protein n=1 Tax=Cladonia borealis TaxID=184061 RepID=A0AA39V2U1_9LECA|nr:hypothetical protein JMJ35_003575 [Cladonia borealis]
MLPSNATLRSLSRGARAATLAAGAWCSGGQVSDPQRNNAQQECEHQKRIKTYQDNKEDGFQERLAGHSKFPASELARAGITHGQDGQSLHTTNRSEAGESIRTSSVATSTSFDSSEAPESYSPHLDSVLSRRRHDVWVNRPTSDHSDETGETGSCVAPPLTSSQSSCVSGLSVSDGMGERALDQSMRLLGEDGTVGNTFFLRGRILECPFHRITGCQKEFFVANSEAWVKHTQSHFIIKDRRGGRPEPAEHISPPTLNSCGFCEEKFEAINGNTSWGRMMSHVKEHHELGHRLAHARIDFSLVEYLWQNRLLTLSEYRDLKPSKDVPSPPSLSEDEGPVAVLEERRHRVKRSSARRGC